MEFPPGFVLVCHRRRHTVCPSAEMPSASPVQTRYKTGAFQSVAQFSMVLSKLFPPAPGPLTAAFLLASLATTFAASPAPSVPKVHSAGRIRIFYQTEGQHAVLSADENHNGVPDQVEDALTQTVAAQTLWVEALGFPDPFQTARFRTASYLDIHFRHKEVLKSNGVTYDELQRYRHAGDPEGTLSLGFNLATSCQADRNLTPAHEFFHVIQNSITYFKNRWYTEGTARWSEHGLGLDSGLQVKNTALWPLDATAGEKLFAMSYDAAAEFWAPLAARLDPPANGELPPSAALEKVKAMTYVNGSKVLKDSKLSGWAFVRDVLQALDKMDDEAFREQHYDRWSEANQRSAQNNAYIQRAVEEAVRKRERR